MRPLPTFSPGLLAVFLIPIGPIVAAEPDGPVPANPFQGMQAREEVFAFAEKPDVTRQGDTWIITFASKAACDATVTIIGPDGRPMCHLASGVLGRNAPYPFQQGSLSQKLEWDGLDDRGEPAPAGCKARVSLGLKASFAWTAPMLGPKGESLKPERSLSREEAKSWPTFTAPDGAECLVPLEMRGEFARKDARRLWEDNRRYQVAVDPVREEVYVSGGQTCFNGIWHRLDGRTGKWDPDFKISAMEIAVHPASGLLYLRDMKGKRAYENDWSCHFLSRRDHDGKIVKFTVPHADEDGEVLMPSDHSAKDFGDGMAFSPNGDLYVLVDIRSFPAIDYRGARPGPSVIIYDAEGNQKPWRKTVFDGKARPRKSVDKEGNPSQDFGRRMEVPAGGTCGIGADRFGNFCVGSTARPVGRSGKREDAEYFAEEMADSEALKTSSEASWFLRMYSGSVIKFGPSGGQLSDREPATHWWWGNGSQYSTVRMEGALWTCVGVTPLTTSARACVCQQARIGMDASGRVLVPQCHRQSILVIDSNANPVLRVGRYGNAESDGIRFTMPKYVAASDTALYVADRALGRVLKATLSYAAEETVPLP